MKDIDPARIRSLEVRKARALHNKEKGLLRHDVASWMKLAPEHQEAYFQRIRAGESAMSAKKAAQWQRVLQISHSKKRKAITGAGRRGARLLKYMSKKRGAGKMFNALTTGMASGAGKTIGALAAGGAIAYAANKLWKQRQDKKGMALRKTGLIETEKRPEI